MLGGLVEEIARVDGWERATALLRAVGQRAASGAAAPADREGRVAVAAAALRSLGGDVEVQRTERGYTLQGYACPLSAVTAKHPEVCALARALVEEITGQPVTECCERNGRPRCGFRIDDETGVSACLFSRMTSDLRTAFGPLLSLSNAQVTDGPHDSHCNGRTSRCPSWIEPRPRILR